MARTAVRPPTDPRNSKAVFDGWFERHSGELRSFATRLTGDAATGEDVVQETFTRAWLHIDELSQREEVGPWLYRVARNLCVDTHRARRRVVPSEAASTADNASARGRFAADYGDGMDVADPARHIERTEDAELVRRALTALTPRHRDVLFLRDIEGMAYDELGRRHGLSGESARAVIARARRRLRDELKTLSNGVLGVGLACRMRVADLFHRAGGDRAPVEPVAAAMAQQVAVAAAIVGMAFGGFASTAGEAASSERRTHDEERIVSVDDGKRVSASDPASPEAPQPGHQLSRPPSTAPPAWGVTLEMSPERPQAVPGNPDAEGGEWVWIEWDPVQFDPDALPIDPDAGGRCHAPCEVPEHPLQAEVKL